MDKNQRNAYLFALGAVTAWSTVSTAFKISLRFLTPLGLLLFSSLAATMFLLGFNLIKHKRKIIVRITQGFQLSIATGLLNPLLYYLMLFEAYRRLPAQEAQVLNYTWAIVLSLLSVLILRERFRLKDLGALGLSFLGVIIISTQGRILNMSFDDPFGSALAVSTSIVWALYWILNMRDRRPAELKLLTGFLVGTAGTFVYALVSHKLHPDGLFTPKGQIGWGLAGAAYVGVFEMGLTFILWQKALERSSNTASVANLIFLTPFISLVFIALVLKEPIRAATLIGLLLIVCSNVWQKSKRERTDTAATN